MIYEVKRGVSIVELIIVIIIIAILASLAMPIVSKTRERALDKEATANLKLIQAAEKIYRIENTFYYHLSGTADTLGINLNLRLSLSTGETRNWDYNVTGGTTGFNTQGRRYNPPAGWDRTWSINQTQDEPTCSGSNCPP